MSNEGSPVVGFVTLLFLIFVVLKLLGQITWSWVWVFSPLWILGGLWLSAVAVILAVIAYVALTHKD